MIENEDGTMMFKKITVEEYMAADEDQRKEMVWWYGGIDELEVTLFHCCVYQGLPAKYVHIATDCHGRGYGP